ncbi:MAG: ATP-binding protein [Pseudorhodoplanes sp.]
MIRPLRAFLPDRIGVQIALLIVASLVVIHLVIGAFLFWNRNELQRRPPPGPAGEVASAIRLLTAVPKADRPLLMQQLRNAFPRVDLADGTELAAETIQRDRRADFLRRDLGPQFQVAVHGSGASDGQNNRMTIRLPDGDILTAGLALESPPPFLGPVIATLMFIFVSISLLALWAARALAAPLRRFVNAAEAFSPDVSQAPVPEQGPFEIRAAAKALNRLTHRIKGLIEDRTRLLAAMGHDLRTPITRMRLRSEFIEDHGLRGQMLRDLDQMRRMIDAALTHLRERRSREAKTGLDIAVLLQTVCEEFRDLGGDVRYEGPAHLAVSGWPDDLQRAFSNLIDNALRYAGRATVRLSSIPQGVRIDVEDNGPGIPHADKPRMLEPFTRGDDARGMNDTTGFGLGLSIANSVARAHDGGLLLLDADPAGLLVRIELPA